MKSMVNYLIILISLVCLLPLAGCTPGGSDPVPQDSESLASLPYTLRGENEHWVASYNIQAIEESEKQSQQASLDAVQNRFGADSSAYRQQQQYTPAYAGTFTLSYKGGEEALQQIKKYTVTFAPGTPYEKITAMQRNSGQAGFDQRLLGQDPLFTASFAEDAGLMGAIPPAGGTYELSIRITGLPGAESTLTMQRQE